MAYRADSRVHTNTLSPHWHQIARPIKHLRSTVRVSARASWQLLLKSLFGKDKIHRAARRAASFTCVRVIVSSRPALRGHRWLWRFEPTTRNCLCELLKLNTYQIYELMVKAKKGIAVCRQACHHRYGHSHAIWDHTVLPATRQRWHSRLYPSRSWYSI